MIIISSQKVKEDYLKAWLDRLSDTPRSPQLFTKDHPLLIGLEQVLLCCFVVMIIIIFVWNLLFFFLCRLWLSMWMKFRRFHINLIKSGRVQCGIINPFVLTFCYKPFCDWFQWSRVCSVFWSCDNSPCIQVYTNTVCTHTQHTHTRTHMYTHTHYTYTHKQLLNENCSYKPTPLGHICFINTCW